MSIAEPPSAPTSVANAAGRSVRRSPLLWIFGALAVFSVVIVVGVIAVVVAYNAGAARRVSPKAGTSTPSAFTVQRPVVPIKVGVRKAGMGDGYVLTFANDGERHLKFTVTHKRTTLNQQSSFSLRLDPGRSIEQGWNEGHTFYPGDTVVISHDDFSNRELIVDPSQKTGFRLVTGSL